MLEKTRGTYRVKTFHQFRLTRLEDRKIIVLEVEIWSSTLV